MRKLVAFVTAFIATLMVAILPVMGIDDPLITGAEEQVSAADDATPPYRTPQCPVQGPIGWQIGAAPWRVPGGG